MRVNKRDLACSVRLAFDLGYEAGVNRARGKELSIVRRSIVDQLVKELMIAKLGWPMHKKRLRRQRVDEA
jgi:hypothetical protein